MKILQSYNLTIQSVISTRRTTVGQTGQFLQYYNITVSQSHTIVQIYTHIPIDMIVNHTHIHSTYSAGKCCNFVRSPKVCGFGRAREITAKCDPSVIYRPHLVGAGADTRKTTHLVGRVGRLINAQLLIRHIIGSYFCAVVVGSGWSGGCGKRSGSKGGSRGRAIPPGSASRPCAPALCQRRQFRSDSQDGQARVPVRPERSEAYWANRWWEAWRWGRRWWWRDLVIMPGDMAS